jgi:hypothetical protein
VRTTDPAAGRLISPIVAAALCVKPRELLSENQAAKANALKSCWSAFAAMRQLAMRFRGLLRSKHVAKPGVGSKMRISPASTRCSGSPALYAGILTP